LKQYPLSGVVGKKEILDSANPGEIGGTYAGNPLACEAALKVIDIIEKEQLNARSEEIGQKIEDQIKTLSETYHCITKTRRLGAMVAFELVDEKTGEPNKALTGELVKAANDNGLLLLSAGIKGNVIRFLTPLVITEDELEKGFAILNKAFAEINA
jgi:4-aminobutyrate aminotransferase/(S)-3-amino-2-methylpropionate transaminase